MPDIAPDLSKVNLTRRVLVYIPVYNGVEYVVRVIREIPPEIWAIADVMVIDNRSADGTPEAILAAAREGSLPGPVTLIQPPVNLGFAGSQKLAYRLAIDSGRVEWVMVLHGDGQYASELTRDLVPFLDSRFGIVYGFRDKALYGRREETPFTSYLAIRWLSRLESLITGFDRREWHSGFVMHSVRFLRRLDLDRLTPSMHIDGHLLFAAGCLGEPVTGIPIFKRYREYEGLAFLVRLRYVANLTREMVRFFRSRRQLPLAGPRPPVPPYAVLCHADAERVAGGDGA